MNRANAKAWPVISLKTGVDLVIARIDSDADVRPNFPGHSRLLARGNFVTQLRRLETMWQGASSGEIRVLLLHHSRMNTRHVLGMSSSSRRALDSLIARCEVSVLLTGHTHVPRGAFWRANHSTATWDVVEARCGTTTQRDVLPLGYAPGPAPLEPNSLLVHRLYETQNLKIIWETEWFQRAPTGFKSRGLLPFQGLPSIQPIVLWPR